MRPTQGKGRWAAGGTKERGGGGGGVDQPPQAQKSWDRRVISGSPLPRGGLGNARAGLSCPALRGGGLGTASAQGRCGMLQPVSPCRARPGPTWAGDPAPRGGGGRSRAWACLPGAGEEAQLRFAPLRPPRIPLARSQVLHQGRQRGRGGRPCGGRRAEHEDGQAWCGGGRKMARRAGAAESGLLPRQAGAGPSLSLPPSGGFSLTLGFSSAMASQ